MSKLTIKQIQDKINAIEASYYKGWKQGDEWWLLTGDVHPTDRRLRKYYYHLLNKRKEKDLINSIKN